jgi:hypothetical protein
MNQALVGRGIAAVGVVLGFVAIFVKFASAGGESAKYSDDGTVLAFLLAALILTAMLLAASLAGRDDLDMAAAVTGSAAFGFYLFIPSAYGFNHFDVVDTGGWLGICAGLIPLGLVYARAARSRAVTGPPLDMALPVIVGRICCLVAIWLTVEFGTSYWNFIDQGRAMPALMLLLVIGGAVLGMMTSYRPTTHLTADGSLVLAAITFGLYEALLIGDAFDEFGKVGTGAWLGSAGAAVLLVGAVRLWQAATGGAPARTPAPAVAPPAV